MAPRAPKGAPRARQEGPGILFLGAQKTQGRHGRPCWKQLLPEWVAEGPRGPGEGPKRAPEGLRGPRNSAKKTLSGLKEAPKSKSPRSP